MNIEEIINQRVMQQSCKIRFDVGLSEASKGIIERNGFSVDALSRVVNSVVVYYPNIAISGIGLKNKNGGLLFFSDVYIRKPVALVNMGNVFMPNRFKARSRRCCVFLDMLDYLSYITLLHDEDYRLDFPANCDCFIIADITNFVSVMLDTESYERTFCMFPNTIIGFSMALTLRSRNPNNTDDLSRLYRGYLSLHDFLLVINKDKTKLCSGL